MTDAVETMAYSGEVPWHGLGRRVSNDLTSEEMLVAAQLNWEVEKIPAYFTFNGKEHSTGRQALVRTTDGRVLTITSNDWEPVQNADAFEFFHDFVQSGDMEMHTAGSLNDGKMVWALAKVNDSFRVFGEDQIDSYLLLSSPHEYGRSVDIRFTPIRVVCNNTLTLALNKKADLYVKLNHRRRFDAALATHTLGVAHEKLAEYKKMAEFLGSKRYTPKTVQEYLASLFPSASKKQTEGALHLSRPAATILDILDTQPGHEFAPGSWWSAFNATTFATDHLLGHTVETRMASSWYGVNRGKKVAALNLAVEFAEAA